MQLLTAEIFLNSLPGRSLRGKFCGRTGSRCGMLLLSDRLIADMAVLLYNGYKFVDVRRTRECNSTSGPFGTSLVCRGKFVRFLDFTHKLLERRAKQ